jgi:CoA:oxalate CoA-transferase
MRPLEGIKVLDFSRVVAGPVAGRMLADLGADVVKIEPPDGDVTRLWGAVRNGISGAYQQQNAGKRNVSIDMRADGSVELIKGLAAQADIVIENYRAGVMDRLGVGWPVLSAVNPRLIMVSISGFGQVGPESARGAFAPVIEAEVGLVHRQSRFDAQPPTDPMLSIADYNAGLHGLIGVLAALHASKASGHGTHVDIAMVDAMLATDDYLHYSIDGIEPIRLGGEYYRLPEGGWILVSGQFRHVWAQVSKARAFPDPAPADADLDTKIALRRAAFAAWFASFPTDAVVQAALDSVKIEWGVLTSPADALAAPTAVHRNVVAQVDDRGGSTRGVVQSPYRFSAYESGVRGGGAFRGEHNAEVLGEWLGYSAEQVTALSASGLLAADPA